MKILLLTIFSFFLAASVAGQSQYKYSIDLKSIDKDRVSVKLLSPGIEAQEAVFSFAQSIPGAYSAGNFGRFISHLNAFDKDGKKLEVIPLSENQYKIFGADKMVSISYKVSDTWDENNSNIFRPIGTNIDEGSNFVINNHAFFGYFEGYSTLPVSLLVTKPDNFFGATSLKSTKTAVSTDEYFAANYKELADNPIIYAPADTTSFIEGKTRIRVSVFSGSRRINSKNVAEILKPAISALSRFLDGLPVKSYQFLYYFENQKVSSRVIGNSASYGALEHGDCSLYYLPETPFENELKNTLLEVSTHELLHLLTPLQLHSKEIEQFDFTTPKVSQHLWLYEGVTEYFTQLFLLRNKLIDEKKFIENMQEKITASKSIGDFSMTEMSKGILIDSMQKKFPAVYTRGALIAFMLDLEIREKTLCKKTLRSVIQTLTDKYGSGRPFDDQSFFRDFVDASHPEIQEFIDKYIKGALALPLKKYFLKIGYDCHQTKRVDGFWPGRFDKSYDEKQKAIVLSNVKRNPFGIKNGDILHKIQDTEVTRANADLLWKEYFSYNLHAPEVYLIVKRKGIDIPLSAKLYSVYYYAEDYLEKIENPNESQRKGLTDISD